MRRSKKGVYRKYILLTILSVFILSLGVTIKFYNLDFSILTNISFYENIANPSVRIIKINEGLRKEEIAKIMGDKLGWDEGQKEEFLNAHLALNRDNLEGYYFPKTYMIQKDEDPVVVSNTMFREFTKATTKINKPKMTNIINQETAVKIASIIQREASGKSDMKLISGIIWNRIFSGMKLQMDATLQYAKGTEQNGWWTTVNPKDKQIDSPYNTYLYEDLPPSPIANPGIAALDAAYNPQKTSCLYYIHDSKRKIHCAKTYEEHKKNIDKYY
ncbi:MAG: endolytic transglycosylase MltG [Parcubacteria group bacterium]